MANKKVKLALVLIFIIASVVLIVIDFSNQLTNDIPQSSIELQLNIQPDTINDNTDSGLDEDELKLPVDMQ